MDVPCKSREILYRGLSRGGDGKAQVIWVVILTSKREKATKERCKGGGSGQSALALNYEWNKKRRRSRLRVKGGFVV